MFYIILFLILFIIIFLFFIYKKKEFFEINNYKQIMKNNNKEKLYKIKLNENIKLETEDCFEKCGKSECIKMNSMKKILEKCINCNSQKNKCFNKSIIGGVCDDCNNSEEKIDCFNIQNFGCTNPYNIDNNNGGFPYFVEIPDENINSPYNKKCVFCWNLLDNI